MDYKAEYQAQMTALADSIREKAGTSAKMTIDQMPSAVDGIEPGIDIPTQPQQPQTSQVVKRLM